jgi:hypothetical protein
MEKSDIEEIYGHFLVDGITMSPKIMVIWRNKEGILFEFRMKVSREFVQDLNGGEELNKKLLPYIRNEKLNKLIN